MCAACSSELVSPPCMGQARAISQPGCFWGCGPFFDKRGRGVPGWEGLEGTGVARCGEKAAGRGSEHLVSWVASPVREVRWATEPPTTTTVSPPFLQIG